MSQPIDITHGWEVTYQILNRQYAVFLRYETLVRKLARDLEHRNRPFTVRYAQIDNATGKICWRGAGFDLDSADRADRYYSERLGF